jgi:hypothetical protein
MMAPQAEERVQPLLLESPRRLAVRMRAVGDNDQTVADAATASVHPGGPMPQERLHGKRRVVDFPLGHEGKPREHNRQTEDELRRRLRQMDALVFAVGLLLFAVAAAATYLYWEYARPFVATDDPFLAARHFLVIVRALAAPCPAWERAAEWQSLPRHGG